jgi:methyl-accepting chemotaxis protein
MTDELLISSEKGLFKRRIYSIVGFMAGSAIFISSVIIVWFNTSVSSDLLSEVYGKVELAAITLMPYMISAVVAAITAIGIITILPSARFVEPVEQILTRIRDLACGDLAGTVFSRGNSQLRILAQELNRATANLNSDVTDLKIINRQQWGLLCEIRMWAENHDCETLLVYVNEMEKNWDKIAEIEERYTT